MSVHDYVTIKLYKDRCYLTGHSLLTSHVAKKMPGTISKGPPYVFLCMIKYKRIEMN